MIKINFTAKITQEDMGDYIDTNTEGRYKAVVESMCVVNGILHVEFIFE